MVECTAETRDRVYDQVMAERRLGRESAERSASAKSLPRYDDNRRWRKDREPASRPREPNNQQTELAGRDGHQIEGERRPREDKLEETKRRKKKQKKRRT